MRFPMKIVRSTDGRLRQGKGHHVTLNDNGTGTFTLKSTPPAEQRHYDLHEIKHIIRTAVPPGERNVMLMFTPGSLLKLGAAMLLAFLVPNLPGGSLLSWLSKAVIVGFVSIWLLLVPVVRIIVEFKDGISFSGLIPKAVWGRLNEDKR